MIFHNSGIDFWRQNASNINCKMTSKIAYLNLIHFGLKIRHKIPPRRSQDAHMTPQEDPRRSKTSPRRLQDNPKTPPRRFKILSRRPQDGSKLPQHASKTPQYAPRRLQDASKTPPDLDFGRYLTDCWSIFDWIWIDFWSIFHRFFFIASPSLCCLITCVLGAVAGTQLWCALDTEAIFLTRCFLRSHATGRRHQAVRLLQ